MPTDTVTETDATGTASPEPDTELDVLEAPSGYSTHDEYFAMRFNQGERVVYSVDLSVPQLVATLPKPDPDRPQEGNRRINLSHARGFAEYVQERSNWVALAPPACAGRRVRFHVAGADWGYRARNSRDT